MSVIPPPGNPPPEVAPPSGPPVRMKMRADLTYDRMTYQGVEYWVVKEPLGQKYYQFPPHVFYLLRQLDGEKSIDELQDNYHREYAPKRITRQELQQLLTRFHKDGLVTADVSGQGKELLKRGIKNKWMERLGTYSNVLAIRYRGFDPERILNFLIKYTWWLFTPTAVVITMIASAIALLSVIVNWAEFQAKLPGFDQFFDLRQWYVFVAVLCVTKVFHEFGHGLSCKRLGGECHEIGFMLLVLTPCLYCNVSDSWRLPNKWHRAAIGAAGMYVEIILATIATFVWWFVQPGLVQDICLKVMLISSISTVLFNGNPLLRFDGYYILSDILEIPNLNQKSTRALTTLLGRHWLGLEIPDDQLMPANRPLAFAMFTVASFCYRWFILGAIIMFLTRMLEPYGLESVGIGIALFSMIGLIGMPGYKLYKYMSVPGRLHQVKKVRFSVILAVLLGVIGTVLLVPLPHYLRCDVVVMPDQIETIWIKQPGTLESVMVQPGQQVSANEVLAQFENSNFRLELAKKEAELDENRAAWKSFKRLGDPVSLAEAAKREPIIANLEKQIRQLKEVIQELTIVSPIDGTVLETPHLHQPSSRIEIEGVDQRPLLAGRHDNIPMQRGQRLCEVANLSKWNANVILTEHQVSFAKANQYVKIKLNSKPGQIIESKLVAPQPTDFSLDRENYDAGMPGQPGKPERPKQSRPPDLLSELVAPARRSELQYVGLVPIPADTDVPLRVGLGGQARLFTGYRSLGYRLYWWINQNFRS